MATPTQTHTEGETAPVRQRPTRADVMRDMRTGAGRVANILAVIVTTAAAIFAGILVLHIIFVLFKATPTNGIVKHINTWAGDLAGPFKTLFSFKHKVKGHNELNVKLTETVNYGIAALAYLFGGRIAASLLRRLAP
jgi:cobalamin synthase